MHKAILFVLTCASALLTNAQTQINIGGDFTGGIFSTWTVVDGDGLTPAASVSQFGAAWIYWENSTDTCAASTSYYDPAGQSMDYLITPKISLLTFTKITWRAKSVDASYPDGYTVLISTTDSLPASFTDTLLTVSAESNIWTNHSLHLDLEGYANQDVYLAFVNNTNDGYILLLDDVEVYVSDFASIKNDEDLELSIYPNPSQDFINVSNQGFSEFSIYSFDGKLLITTDESKIDVSSLSPGTYILQGRSETGVNSTQFIKE